MSTLLAEAAVTTAAITTSAVETSAPVVTPEKVDAPDTAATLDDDWLNDLDMEETIEI